MHRGRDEKGLISWNGLVLAAFAEAEWVLNRADCRRVVGGLAVEPCYLDLARAALGPTPFK
jgi:uncharacterized protein YyaL (SSP411 family)